MDGYSSSMLILAGPASTELASGISNYLGCPLGPIDLKVFSDGESRIRLDSSLSGRFCVVVQSIYPPVDRHLIQALMIARGCVKQGAAGVAAVVPYLAYARQDREFIKGEVVSAELISSLIQAAGISRLITVDIHSKMALSYFSIAVENLTAMPLLAKYIHDMGLERPLIVSPDEGGADRARQFAGILGLEGSLVLKKKRDRQTGEVTMDCSTDVDVSGRDVILVDDMISSGASIVKASEILSRLGAARIYATCSHALLLDNAQEKLKRAGITDIISTNSIPGDYARVDLSPLVAESIKLPRLN